MVMKASCSIDSEKENKTTLRLDKCPCQLSVSFRFSLLSNLFCLVKLESVAT